MDEKRGKFLGMPYDRRRPTKKRLKSNAWDREGKVFTPKTVGWGYGINFRALWNRLTGHGVPVGWAVLGLNQRP